MERVSRRTRQRIVELTRTSTVGELEVRYCPCRILPETVLNLKTVMRDIARLWTETLGEGDFAAIRATIEGGRFFAGEVRFVRLQEDRPEMVGVWLPVPPDYPDRLKVQLIDHIEPDEFPWVTSVGTGR